MMPTHAMSTFSTMKTFCWAKPNWSELNMVNRLKSRKSVEPFRTFVALELSLARRTGAAGGSTWTGRRPSTTPSTPTGPRSSSWSSSSSGASWSGWRSTTVTGQFFYMICYGKSLCWHNLLCKSRKVRKLSDWVGGQWKSYLIDSIANAHLCKNHN